MHGRDPGVAGQALVAGEGPGLAGRGEVEGGDAHEEERHDEEAEAEDAGGGDGVAEDPQEGVAVVGGEGEGEIG